MRNPTEDGLRVVTVSRAEFYEQLWTLTSTELMIRYALNPYTLGVISTTHNFPQPPPGYWMRFHNGKFVGRRPMPRVKDPKLESIQLLTLAPDRYKRGPNPVRPEDFGGRHPLVTALEQPADPKARVARPGHPVARVDVSDADRPRALALLDSMLKMFEAEGGETFPGETQRNWGWEPDGVAVAILGSRGQTAGLPTPLEVVTYSQDAPHPPTFPTLRACGRDPKVRAVVVSIFHAVAVAREARFRRRTEARQAAAEAQLKAEEALRARAAQDREALAARLVTEATVYENARRIRRYARAVLRASAASVDPETRAATKQWYEAAMDCSDLLDPIVKRFPAATAGAKPAVIRVGDLDISGDLRLRLARQRIVDTDGIYEEYRTIDERLGYDRDRDEMRVVLRVCGYPVPRGWW